MSFGLATKGLWTGAGDELIVSSEVIVEVEVEELIVEVEIELEPIITVEIEVN